MADVKIFTDNIEGEALNQVYTLAKLPAFENAKVRIMPDVHAGAGCVIGFTANLGDKVIPNIVGVDIGCGMRVVKIGNVEMNEAEFVKLDSIIHTCVPAGHDVHTKINISAMSKYVNPLYCFKDLCNLDRIGGSMGTLGGGNHFIELDIDDNGDKYLVIHTGSRNLGKQVAEIYQDIAIQEMSGANRFKADRDALIAEYKATGRKTEIQKGLAQLAQEYTKKAPKIPKELCYLEGDNRLHYLHDMELCQRFAVQNRQTIADTICKAMGWTQVETFESIHNYISFQDNIVRKGAISAYDGQKVIIPMNMRDGCIIGIGKGNADWNQSAPHGAGRIMSRAAAKENINLEDYAASMAGIFTTSVNQSTIDESPFAYKPMQEIIDNIRDTVDIVTIIKPIYNYKACE